MPVETKTLFVGLLVGLAHIASGAAVLITPEALLTTPLHGLHYVIAWLGYGHGFAGAVLLAAGIMAVGASSRGIYAPRALRATMFFPQQALLMFQLWSISLALIDGRYPDGYLPQGGAWFMLADQIWAWLLAVSHSIWLAAFIYGGASGNGHHR